MRTMCVTYSGCRICNESMSEVVATPVVKVVQFWWGYVVHKSELKKGRMKRESVKA